MRWLALLLLVVAAARAEHRVVELACPAQVSYRVARDLDGDGFAELLLITPTEAWVWHGKAEITQDPDEKWRLPEGAAMFDLGLRGALVVRTAKAYWALRLGGTRKKLGMPSGPGLPSHPTNILWRGFFADFDRDGKPDMIDVSLRGYTIRFAGGVTRTLPPYLAERADTHANGNSERMIARYALGSWGHGDFDGDGRPDFAVVTPKGLVVYPDFDPATSFEVPLQEAKDADLRFLDLNNDQRMDVLAVRRKVGQTTILIGDPEKGLRAPRRTRLTVPGFMRYPVIANFTDDDRLDLALPYTSKPSVQDAVRVLLRGEVILKVPLFLNRGGMRPIRRVADRQMEIPLRIRVGSDAAGRIKLSGLVVVEYEGDLDGDGLVDLVVSLRPTLLAVHRGTRDANVFSQKPSAEIAIPDSSLFQSIKSVAEDLNGDHSSDIILHYIGAGRRPDRVILLLSRKK